MLVVEALEQHNMKVLMTPETNNRLFGIVQWVIRWALYLGTPFAVYSPMLEPMRRTSGGLGADLWRAMAFLVVASAIEMALAGALLRRLSKHPSVARWLAAVAVAGVAFGCLIAVPDLGFRLMTWKYSLAADDWAYLMKDAYEYVMIAVRYSRESQSRWLFAFALAAMVVTPLIRNRLSRRWRWMAPGAVLLVASLGLAYVLVERSWLPEECAATEGLGPARDIVRNGIREIHQQGHAMEAEVFAALDRKAAETGWSRDFVGQLYGRALHSPRGQDFYKEKQYLLGELLAIEVAEPGSRRATCTDILRSQELLRRYQEAHEREHAMILEVIRGG